MVGLRVPCTRAFCPIVLLHVYSPQLLLILIWNLLLVLGFHWHQSPLPHHFLLVPNFNAHSGTLRRERYVQVAVFADVGVSFVEDVILLELIKLLLINSGMEGSDNEGNDGPLPLESADLPRIEYFLFVFLTAIEQLQPLGALSFHDKGSFHEGLDLHLEFLGVDHHYFLAIQVFVVLLHVLQGFNF